LLAAEIDSDGTMVEFGHRRSGGFVPDTGSRHSLWRGEPPDPEPAAADAEEPPRQPGRPLGVGGITADAIAIYFQRFGLMFLLSLIPAVIGLLIARAMPHVSSAAVVDPATTGWTLLLASVGQYIASSLSNSLIVLAAFDTRIGRPIRLGVYFQRALSNLFTVLVMSLAMGLVVVIPTLVAGFALAIAAGAIAGSTAAGIIGAIAMLAALLYFFSAFSPFVAAIVVEGAGFRALGRAWNLTAGYRWPVVGVVLVLFIMIAVIELAGGVLGLLAGRVEATVLPVLVSLATSAVVGGIMAVGFAMIYARLRGLKEGLDIESLADVFS
jgi:hypothetical protein